MLIVLLMLVIPGCWLVIASILFFTRNAIVSGNTDGCTGVDLS